MKKSDMIAFTPSGDCITVFHAIQTILAEENPMYYFALKDACLLGSMDNAPYEMFVRIGLQTKEEYNFIVSVKKKIADILARYCRSDYRFSIEFYDMERIDNVSVNWDCKEKLSKEK